MPQKILFCVFLVLLAAAFCASAGEVKLTTYYPAPYGEYNRVVTKTLGVGDANNDGSITGTDAPDPVTAAGDVWIEGKVGIGTRSPNADLGIFKTVAGEALRLETNNDSNPIYMSIGGGAAKSYIGMAGAGTIGTNAIPGGLGINSIEGIQLVNSNDGTYGVTIKDGRVGIGTISPGAKLQVISPSASALAASIQSTDNNPSANVLSVSHTTRGDQTDYYLLNVSNSGGSKLYVRGDGNVGIGTTAPANKLSISSAMPLTLAGTLTGTTNGNGISLANTNGNGYYSTIDFQGNQGVPIARIGMLQTALGSYFNFGTSNLYANGVTNNAFIIDYNSNASVSGSLFVTGSAGIGTATPREKLEVGGNLQVDGNRTYLTGVDGTAVHWLMVGGKAEGTNNALGFDLAKKQVIAGNGWIKNFLIDHPLDPKNKFLAHSTLEGPEAAVFYRGQGRLLNGESTVKLPGYFEKLTRKDGRTVQLTARGKEPFLLSYTDITDGSFNVYGTRSDGEFSWEVKAVRADVAPLETERLKNAQD